MAKSIQERLKRLENLYKCICNSSGGGSQTLAQTLVFGNETGGENMLVNDADAIELENTSLLKKGTYNFGGNGGISRICSNNYEDMWQNGFRHVFDQSGFIRHSTNCFNVIPDSSFDDTLRFAVGSFWTLDDGTTYICTDNTTGAAVWDLYNVGSIPTLQQVLDNNHALVDSNNFQGTGAGVNNTGTSVLGLGLSSAFGNTGVYINALGEGTAYFNAANHVNAIGHEAGQNNNFNNVNLFGYQATADEDGQTVLSKDGAIMARISTTDLTATRKYNLPNASGTLALTAMSAYSIKVNNTNATAVATETTYRSPGIQTYTGSISWAGTTAPSGTTTHSYNWIQVGNLVTLNITLRYSVTGSAITSVFIDLPSDCPSPVKPSGLTSALEKLYIGSGRLSVGTTTTSTSPLAEANLRNNSSLTGFQIQMQNAASIGASLVQVTIQYFTS